MSLNKKFSELTSVQIRNNNDVLYLRRLLIKFKNNGMDKDSILKSLEELRRKSTSETEDTLLDLMDFVVGFCNPDLSIF
ncbi:MAG: hypothetical protein NC489_39750 [Ruminococcus flavefaciens]|nr:hypothetical protein [Ruminococcus flavefaciens]